tara:strand:+ start:698 stop:1003 length:306 start_codon:yes stop_codon:yes gene_type:complete
MSTDFSNLPFGCGLLYNTNGTIETINGPFNLECLYKHINCDLIQVVPCTVGNLKHVALLIMDEDGMEKKEMNCLAMKYLGEQVFGGKLYGNILVIHLNDLL